MNITVISMLALIYFMLFCSFFWVVLYFEKKKELESDPKPKRFPLVSVIIPVYKNDSKKAIKKCIESALNLTYEKKEVIIAWNGPKNEKFDFCKELAKKKKIRLVETSKQGKAVGMNYALKKAKGELFCCLDADSFFHKDALEHMIGYFEDKKIGAVTSSMKVYKADTIWQKIQWVEYIFAIYLRKLSSLIDALYVVPGPGGMYRTDLVKKLGGFDENNLTEDMEIAFRIQDAGYKIKNSLNSFVDTVAPERLWDLIKQRIRWYAGFCDNLKKYKHMLLNLESGMLGMFMLPLSIIWVAVVIYSLGYMLNQFFTNLWLNIKTLRLIGFDWQVFISKLIDSIYFNPTFMTWFAVILTALGILVIYLGLEMSKEDPMIKYKYPHYIAYLLVYSILIGVFWIFTFGYLLTRKRLKKDLW